MPHPGTGQTYRDLAGATRAGRDRLGWLPERAVGQLLAAAVTDGQVGGPGLTVLEGFPGSTEQARLLHHLGLSLTADVRVVELDAPGPVLAARTRARRVCRGCEPGAGGDPHRPACADAVRPGRCAACGSRLTRRTGDAPAALAARTDRYRRRLPGIRRVAEGLRIPYRVFGGATGPGDCLAAVLAFCDQTIPADRIPVAGAGSSPPDDASPEDTDDEHLPAHTDAAADTRPGTGRTPVPGGASGVGVGRVRARPAAGAGR